MFAAGSALTAVDERHRHLLGFGVLPSVAESPPRRNAEGSVLRADTQYAAPCTLENDGSDGKDGNDGSELRCTLHVVR